MNVDQLVETKTLNKVLTEKTWKALTEVADPEIPVISVVDLGIISSVEETAENAVRIMMTPTFSGCPAIQLMCGQIRKKVAEKLPGISISVDIDYNNQWDTNRISETGLKALKKFGLAPPPRYSGSFKMNIVSSAACPYCDSTDTIMQSPFGPTLCRSIHYCNSCCQSFEQFKPV